MIHYVKLVILALTPCLSSAFAPLIVRSSTTSSISSPSSSSYTNHILITNTNSIITSLHVVSAVAEPSTKIYSPSDKESPNFLGGLSIGLRQLVVITGASSGLGLNCAASLAKTGNYFVVMACRDVEKAKKVAKEMNMPEGSYIPMKLELASLQSVRDFVANLKAFKGLRPLNHLICNAAVYKPTDPQPAWTDDGFEMSMGVNHLGHFLLVNLLLSDLAKAKNARVCIVGSITGNTNTIGGGLVYPRADLGNLKGLESGGKKPIAMADGKPFFGAKAYKDSKVCNMMTVTELHKRYHDKTGIIFSSMYPGCIAETALFREKRPWFRTVFPLFMKYVTGGYVSETEAGDRLAQVITDPTCSKSDIYWSWNGNAQQIGSYSTDGKPRGAGGSGGEIFENEQSDAVRDPVMTRKVWEASVKAVGLTEKELLKV